MSDKFNNNSKSFKLWPKTSKNKDILSEADDIISKLISKTEYKTCHRGFRVIVTSFICAAIALTVAYVIVKF